MIDPSSPGCLCLMLKCACWSETCKRLTFFFLPAAMLSSFLLLVFLPLCLGCQTSSFTECQKVPFVPGHNLVGEGFDVVKLQTSGALVVNVKDYMVGGAQGNCTVCHNRLLNQVPPLPKLFQQFQSCRCCFCSLTEKCCPPPTDPEAARFSARLAHQGQHIHTFYLCRQLMWTIKTDFLKEKIIFTSIWCHSRTVNMCLHDWLHSLNFVLNISK